VARRPPPITKIIVGINVAVFAAMVLSGISLTEPTTQQLLTWGANFGPLSLGTQPWRIFASNYLHIGIIHIALNMWCLWNLGLLAERIFDPWTYVLTYTACGIAGSIASLGLHPMVVGAGASGAIFGLAGALITALYMGKLPIPKHALSPIMRSLVTFAGYNLFFGAVVPGIDNSAHIGGLLAGLALGAALAQTLTSQPEVRHRWRLVIFVVATILLFAAFSLVKQTRGPELPQQEIPTAEDRPLDKPLRAYKKNLSVAVATLKTT
jgi:rhomboid protease GluP